MPLIRHSFAIICTATCLLSACSEEKSAAEYLASAEAYIESNDTSSALIEVRNAARKDPDSPTARLLLGNLELASGNPSTAENELLKARELGIPDVEIIAPLGEAYWLLRNLDALDALDIEALADSSKAQVLGYQAESAIIQSRLPKAAELTARALKIDNTSPIAITANARLQAIEKNITIARANLTSVNVNNPDYSAAWELLGDIETEENRLSEALDAYSNAISTSTNIVEPLFKRAKTHLALNDLAAAEKDVEIFKQRNIKSPFIYLIESEVLLRNGKFSGAQIALEEGLRIAPNFLPAVRSLSVTHMLNNNLGQAEQYAKQYFDAADSDDSRNLLAIVRLQADRPGQVEQALKPLSNAGRLGQLGSQVLATSLLKQDKLDEAVTTMLELRANIEQAGISDFVPLAMTNEPATFMSKELFGDTLRTDSVIDTTQNNYISLRDQQLIDAVSALADDNTSDALSAVNQLIEVDKNNADLHTLMARIHAVADNTEAAISSADTAIAAENTPATAFIIKAILSITPENSIEAISILESILSQFEGSEREQIILTLGRISATAGNTEQMLAWLDKAKLENPGSYRPSLALANHYTSTSESEKVLIALNGLSSTSEQNPSVVELNVRAHIALQQFDQAITSVTPILQREPNNGRWRLLRAMAFAGKQDKEAVGRDLDVALRIDPDNVEATLAKANLSLLNNDLAQAEILLARLQALIPDTAALALLSERVEGAKQPVAVAAQTPKMSENPSTTKEVMDTANLLWSQDKQLEAVDVLTTWLEKAPRDTAIQLMLASVYTALDQPEGAITAYEAVIELDKNHVIALNNLAWQLREQQPDTAIEYARRAVAIQPENIATLDTLAVIQYQRGLIDDADSTFNRILALNPDNPTVLFHGARIQAAQGKNDSAKEILEKLVNSGVDFPELEAAKQLLNSL